MTHRKQSNHLPTSIRQNDKIRDLEAQLQLLKIKDLIILSNLVFYTCKHLSIKILDAVKIWKLGHYSFVRENFRS